MSDGARQPRRDGGDGRIETIFWDIGGVLLTNGWDQGQRGRVLASLGVDVPAYEAVHDRENWFWERGLMSAEEFFRRTVMEPNAALGLRFETLWPLVCGESRVLHPECFDVLLGLRGMPGVRLATLNNESRELNGYRLDAFGLRESFDFLVCSGYVGEMKPAAAIYRTAIEISGRPAETGLFIDDKVENCEAARASGMQAIHFQTPAQLTSELLRFGIETMSIQTR